MSLKRNFEKTLNKIVAVGISKGTLTLSLHRFAPVERVFLKGYNPTHPICFLRRFATCTDTNALLFCLPG